MTRHKIAADDELRKAIAAIGQAVAAKNFAEAYRVRNALLDAYPDSVATRRSDRGRR